MERIHFYSVVRVSTYVYLYKESGFGLVGMSTVNEVIAANHMGLETLGISCVTNLAAGISKVKLTHEEVALEGKRASSNFRALVLDIIESIDY